MKHIFILIIFIFPFTAFAQTISGDTIRIHSNDLLWKEAPLPFPAGAKIVSMEGSSKQDGLFTIRVQFPPNYILPAHFHPKDERVTVISGSVFIGFGEVADTNKGTEFKAGDFYINPAQSHHFVYTKDEGAIVQLNCEGPWGLNYLEK